MLRWILMRDDDHRQKTVKCSWFVGVEKRAVLAEVIMCFGDPRDKRRCLQMMKMLLYLLNQGETFTKSEATALLFSVTKLFQFDDVHLRRLIYLIAQELCPIAEEVDMLESAIVLDLKDINTLKTSLRANAVRLLCRITNVPSSIKVEEYLKLAIESPKSEVSIAGLVCALHLLKKDPGIAIKVCKQVGTVAAKNYGLEKFHALCLLYRMQQIETLGIRELARPHIDKMISYELKYSEKHKVHPLVTCLVIRFITLINRASGESGEAYADYLKYINESFNLWDYQMHRLGDEMVAIEGLYSMLQLRNLSVSEKEVSIERVGRRMLQLMDIRASRKEIYVEPSRWPFPNSHDRNLVFFDITRSVLKWSRIQNRIKVAQLTKSKTDNLHLRKRRIALQY